MAHRIRSALFAFVALAALAPAASAAPAGAEVVLAREAAQRAEAVSPNTNPDLTAPSAVDKFTDQSVTIQATATDVDAANVLTITATGAPASLVLSHTPSMSPATASLGGTLGAGDVGTFDIAWSVDDGAGGSATAHTTLTVGANRDPAIVAPATVLGGENIKIEMLVSYSDPDGDPVVLSTATPLPAGAVYAPSPLGAGASFIWTPSIGQAGTYPITFTVGTGSPMRTASAVTVFTINPLDRPPVITGVPGTLNTTSDITATVTANVSDPDGNPITSLVCRGTQNTPLPPGAVFTTNPTNTVGTLVWTPTPAQVGTYSLDFIATSGVLNIRALVVCKIVVRVDRPPVVVAPPTAGGAENTLIAFTVTASDPDNSAATPSPIASLAGAPLPSGATFTVNAANTSGSFSWTPTFAQAGVYPIVFSASNALTGTATTTITVTNVDRPPVVTSPATINSAEGVPITFVVTAVDPDAEPILTLTVTGQPLGATFAVAANKSSGTFNWTPGFNEAGLYHLTFTATNALSGSVNTDITVTDQNRAPVADANGPYVGVVGVPIAFNGSGSSDPDGQPLLYAWDFGDGATANGPTPSHSYAAMGIYNVSLTVTENAPSALSDVDQTSATVAAGYEARVFTSGGNKTIRLGSGKPTWCAHVEPVNGSFQFSDLDLRSMTLGYNGSTIPAISGKTVVAGDGDKNGVAEIDVCFTKEDLRTLFAGLPPGHQTVDVEIAGNLIASGAVVGSISVEVVASGGGALASVSPNPLNPSATLSFTTAAAGPIRVRLFDISGRLVRTLADWSSAAAGYHDVTIDGRSDRGEELGSGVYFFRIETAAGVESGRFTILR